MGVRVDAGTEVVETTVAEAVSVTESEALLLTVAVAVAVADSGEEDAGAEDADPEVVPEATMEDPDEPETPRPEILNGKEYWNVLTSESRKSWKPYVSNLGVVVGTSQLKKPVEASMLLAMVAPLSRRNSDLPWSRIIVIGPSNGFGEGVHSIL